MNSPQCQQLNEFEHEYIFSTLERVLAGDLAASTTEMLLGPDYLIADTGASCHHLNNTTGCTPSANMAAKLRKIKPSMTADGSKMMVKKILDKRAVTSKGQQIKLMNCRYGASKFNLCAVNKLTNNGWEAMMDKTGIHLQNGKGQVISFGAPNRCLYFRKF